MGTINVSNDIIHLFLEPFRAIYTGFFFKLWDNVFGTLDPSACSCVDCRPRRSKKEWEGIEKPDYKVLTSLNWWLNTDSKELGSSRSAKDDS